MEISITQGLFFTSLITFVCIYLLASLSGLLSEKSGIVNIALDGKMIIGALVFSCLMSTENFSAPLGSVAPYIAIFIAGIFTMIFSFVLSFIIINLMADHVIAGTALNIFAPAFALIIMNSFFSTDTITFGDTSAGWASTINTVSIIMLLITLLIVFSFWIIFKKTYLGLRISSSGENPYSLETAGISVKKVRWITMSIAGFLTGIAGALFPIALGSGTFNSSVNGSGFLSIAILIIGQWKVSGIFFASIFLALLNSLATTWISFGINFPNEIIHIIPFLMPIIFLIFIKSTNSPKFLGKPYKKDIR